MKEIALGREGRAEAVVRCKRKRKRVWRKRIRQRVDEAFQSFLSISPKTTELRLHRSQHPKCWDVDVPQQNVLPIRNHKELQHKHRANTGQACEGSGKENGVADGSLRGGD